MQATPAALAPAVKAPAHRWHIRCGQTSDEGFVAESWAKTFQGSDASIRRIHPNFFNRSVYPRIEELLHGAEVRIASPADDDVTIYGFAVLEPGLVHMVYVKKPWRRLGIAAALLQGVDLGACDWGTQSQDFREWIRHKYPMANYRPFWMQERK